MLSAVRKLFAGELSSTLTNIDTIAFVLF